MSIRIAPNAIERLCEQQGVSRNELARSIGVTTQTAYRVEHGRTPPSNYFIGALLSLAARLYGGKPEEHFGLLFEVGA